MSEMALLIFKAEVFQIRLFSLCNSPNTHPDSILQREEQIASVQQFLGQQMQDPLQGYWFTPGLRQSEETA